MLITRFSHVHTEVRFDSPVIQCVNTSRSVGHLLESCKPSSTGQHTVYTQTLSCDWCDGGHYDGIFSFCNGGGGDAAALTAAGEWKCRSPARPDRALVRCCQSVANANNTYSLWWRGGGGMSWTAHGPSHGQHQCRTCCLV